MSRLRAERRPGPARTPAFLGGPEASPYWEVGSSDVRGDPGRLRIGRAGGTERKLKGKRL